MNSYKLFMAASAVALATVSVAVPTTQAYGSHSFTDVGERYDESVSFLYEIGVIRGISTTQFGTANVLTRGDAAVIMANMMGLDTDMRTVHSFTDLNERVEGSVNALVDAGIVSGVTATQYKPNEPLSRGAMAKLLVTAFELEGYETETPFTDAGGVFLPYIEAIYGTGITNGKTATSYGTYDAITRGEFANLLYNTFMFAIDLEYYPTLSSAEMTSPLTVEVQLTEAVPEEYSALDTADFFYYSLILEDGTEARIELATARLSEDRMAITLTFKSVDLTGKAGMLKIDDYEGGVTAPFDFK